MWWGGTNHGIFNLLDPDWQSEQMNITLSKLGRTSDNPIKEPPGVMIAESIIALSQYSDTLGFNSYCLRSSSYTT